MVLALALLAVATAAVQIFDAPSLGMRFEAGPGDRGLIVSSVSRHSPNHGRIEAGTLILALENARGERVELLGLDRIEEPDVLGFGDFFEFLDRQERLYTLLQAGEVTALLSGDQRIALSTTRVPTEQALLYFILQAAYGLAALSVALGIWVFKPNNAATQLYAASGIFVLGVTLTLAVYGGRDLVVQRDLFLGLSVLNHLCTLLCAALLLSLVWVYPRPLHPRVPMPLILIMLAVALWLLDTLRVGAGSARTVYLPCAVAFVAGAGFCWAQWSRSRGRPLDRAVLKWFIAAMITGSSLLTVLVVLPSVFGYSPLVSMLVGFAAFLVLYFGMAAGISRYRLFDVDRWWFRFWLWFGGGLAVLLLDVALVMLTGLADDVALVLALATVGWLYFPVRQWLFERFTRQSRGQFDRILRDFVEEVFSRPGAHRILDVWPELLRRTFKPLQLERVSEPVTVPSLSLDGTRMRLPDAVEAGGGWRLHFPEEGGRLFQQSDLETAGLLLDLIHAASRAAAAREAGAHQERRRIMRDLHDDLGARLLSMVYATTLDEGRENARAALDDMHGVIDSASGAPATPAEIILAAEGETRRRLLAADLRLDWRLEVGELPKVSMSSRWGAHLRRVVREAVSNIIRHANASQVLVEWRHADGHLHLRIDDDGRAGDPEGWSLGNGRRAMRKRSEELGATISWTQIESGGCRVELSMPVEAAPAMIAPHPFERPTSV